MKYYHEEVVTVVGNCLPLGVNKYDTVPIHRQTANPMPTYFSHSGNDEEERMPFDLPSPYDYTVISMNA